MINGSRKRFSTYVSLSFVFAFVCLCLGVPSCNPKTQDVAQGISFSKIYDKSDEISYTSVDIKQLPDGGYIILGRVDMGEQRPYVLRLDSNGNALWETNPDDFTGFFLPTADILVFNQDYYFFCNIIDGYKMQIALLKISEDESFPEQVDLSDSFLKGSFLIPMDAKISGEHILLYAINGFTNKLVFLKINRLDGSTIGESETLRFDGDCTISYPPNDMRFNFFESAGNPGEKYYYHGYIEKNYDFESPPCLGITELDILNDQPALTDIHYVPDRPFLALEMVNNKLYGARVGQNIISFVLNFELEDDINSNPEIDQSELNAIAPVCIKAMQVNDQSMVFFAGSAKNNRIVLYGYNRSTGEYITKLYFGHTHIYAVSALIETEDNGLAILGTTFVSGQIGRICLFKLSKSDLEDTFSQ